MSNTGRKWKYDRENKCLVEITPKREEHFHFVQEDSIDPVESLATNEGKIFDSRSKLMAHYKENGVECTGGSQFTGRGLSDASYKADKEEIKDMAAKAHMDIKYDRIPISEKEKETCRREERQYQSWKQRNWHR